MKQKRMMAVASGAVLALGMTACSGGTTSTASNSGGSTAATQNAAVGQVYKPTATKGGTLKLEILRSGADGVYTAKAHADVTVSDATESVTTITLMGERGLRVTFTPGADGVITYADIAAILGIQ